jgi:hypothetical protein
MFRELMKISSLPLRSERKPFARLANQLVETTLLRRIEFSPDLRVELRALVTKRVAATLERLSHQLAVLRPMEPQYFAHALGLRAAQPELTPQRFETSSIAELAAVVAAEQATSYVGVRRRCTRGPAQQEDCRKSRVQAAARRCYHSAPNAYVPVAKAASSERWLLNETPSAISATSAAATTMRRASRTNDAGSADILRPRSSLMT